VFSEGLVDRVATTVDAALVNVPRDRVRLHAGCVTATSICK
jgi:hypothetical protein